VSFNYRPRQLWLSGFFFLFVGLLLMSSCTENPNATTPSGPASAEQAQKFMTNAETRLLDLGIKAARADWVKSTFVTDDTEALAAAANENLIGATTELAEEARRYEALDLSPELKRKLKLLKEIQVQHHYSKPSEINTGGAPCE